MTAPAPPAGATPPPLLQARGIVKVYPAAARGRSPVRAVDGVDLELRSGETLALVGESGSGKSTLARILVGLEAPTAGEVRLDGLDPRALRGSALRAFRRRIQLVFQDPLAALDPRQTAGSALEEVLAVHDLHGPHRGDRALELLRQVGLGPEHLHRFPHQLSGGQRQRLGIARALALEPTVLVLDEPVSALDASVQARVVNLLAELRSSLGLTFLLVAHDLALVERFAQRVAVMRAGQIVEEAPAEELYRAPRHPYTRELLAAVPSLTPRR